MVDMTVVGVRVELPTSQPIVLLKEAVGERYLPIWIGQSEAQSIAAALAGVVAPRPMTHDLMRDLLKTVAVNVDRIDITEMKDSVFYAVIHLSSNGSRFELSSRPSDAIALAVRMQVPISASEEVLDEVGIRLDDEDDGDDDDEVEKFKEFLDQVSPDDFA